MIVRNGFFHFHFLFSFLFLPPITLVAILSSILNSSRYLQAIEIIIIVHSGFTCTCKLQVQPLAASTLHHLLHDTLECVLAHDLPVLHPLHAVVEDCECGHAL